MTRLRPPRRRGVARIAVLVSVIVAGVALAPASPLGATAREYAIGCCLDLPEGFAKTAEQANSLSFTDATGEIDYSVMAYDAGRYPDSAAMLKEVSGKLKASVSGDGFTYLGRSAWCGSVAYSMGKINFKGYLFCVAGHPGERGYLALSVVPENSFKSYDDFLASSIDCFLLEKSAFFYPGPFSWWKHPFDSGVFVGKEVKWEGRTAQIDVRPDWASASQEMIEREYRVLSQYAGVDGLWEKAWARIYRMVWRDSYHRLDSLALVLGAEIDSMALDRSLVKREEVFSQYGEDLNRDYYLAATDQEKADMLLRWVQDFAYTRMPEGSDMRNPLQTALGAEGDCDARALLMSIILNHWNIDSGLAVSQKHAHALALLGLPPIQGRSIAFKMKGKDYVVADTTAREKKVNGKVQRVMTGMIAQDQANQADWLCIDFWF